MRDEFLSPDGLDVCYRALSLGAVITRGGLEQGLKSDHPDATRGQAGHLSGWLEYEGVYPYLSFQEAMLLDKEPGTWTQQEIINASWRVETLGVILWSLSIFGDLQPYDHIFNLDEVLPPLCMLRPIEEFMRHARLRSFDRIAEARDLAELWHWRARTTRIQRGGVEPPFGMTFPEIIKMAAEKAHEDGAIPSPIGDDFPAFGKPYAELREAEYKVATSIAVERHYALNWLCGYSEDWDATPTDT